jgi:RNA polymerase sigma-70 factor (ECF subfamily)
MTSTTHTDDAEMRAKFELLFRDNYQWLRRYVARRTPESRVDDVVASSFIVAWNKFTTVADPSLPWLIRIASFELSNAERKARRATNDIGIELDNLPSLSDESFDGALVRRALANLDSSDQELLRLVHWDELGRSEIADVLGLTPNAVNVRYHRALKKLESELSTMNDTQQKGVRQ